MAVLPVDSFTLDWSALAPLRGQQLGLTTVSTKAGGFSGVEIKCPWWANAVDIRASFYKDNGDDRKESIFIMSTANGFEPFSVPSGGNVSRSSLAMVSPRMTWEGYVVALESSGGKSGGFLSIIHSHATSALSVALRFAGPECPVPPGGAVIVKAGCGCKGGA